MLLTVASDRMLAVLTPPEAVAQQPLTLALLQASPATVLSCRSCADAWGSNSANVLNDHKVLLTVASNRMLAVLSPPGAVPHRLLTLALLQASSAIALSYN